MRRLSVLSSFVLVTVLALVGAFSFGLSQRETIAQDATAAATAAAAAATPVATEAAAMAATPEAAATEAGAAAIAATPAAQDATTQGHPLVGTWLADTDTENQTNPLDAFTFTSDGTYIEVDANGDTQLGAWEATGATTANLTIVSYEGDDEGNNYGGIKIRASIEVSPDGASFTAQFTIEFINPDGTTTGEAGPGTATGTRVLVEAPGTPVMTTDELFSSFENAPEATPVP